VARCVIAVQKPLSLLDVALLAPNCIAQSLKNLHAEMTSNTVFGRYEPMAHQTVDAQESIVQGVEQWIVCTSLTCERFRNTRHTVTFGIPL
jgi:hypothetical protein